MKASLALTHQAFDSDISTVPTTRNSLLSKLKASNFYTRLTQWEYWPFNLVYFPVMFYWIWLSLKARSFFFFSSANPGIEFGGMLGESKWSILNRLPIELRPRTLILSAGSPITEVRAQMEKNEMSFPVIAKPDVGERGWLVEKIDTNEELIRYVSRAKVDFLIQEHIKGPLELGIFYYRFRVRNWAKSAQLL